ncbi:MAG: hypothetical protein RSG52_10180 [Terrisporobacter sp.]|uniref:hypothetical protein n=1 Tax=Clostridia TaxID=186801 RepID=UPI002FCB82CB
MNEEFVKSIYKTIVEENKELYKDLFNNTNISEVSDAYWKQSLKLYNDLSQDKRIVFISVIEQIMIDTVSNIFGIVDGSSTLNGCKVQPKLLLNDTETDGELQDLFLEYIDEIE